MDVVWHRFLLAVWLFWVAGIGLSVGTDCPNYWVVYESSCYWFGTENPFSFVEAEHFCEQMGGHLVQVDSAAENTFLINYLRQNKHGQTWMGLTDILSEGQWVWQATNTSPEFTDWLPGEPNDEGHLEDCVHFSAAVGYHWNDVTCSTLMEPLCERTSQSSIVG